MFIIRGWFKHVWRSPNQTNTLPPLSHSTLLSRTACWLSTARSLCEMLRPISILYMCSNIVRTKNWPRGIKICHFHFIRICWAARFQGKSQRYSQTRLSGRSHQGLFSFHQLWVLLPRNPRQVWQRLQDITAAAKHVQQFEIAPAPTNCDFAVSVSIRPQRFFRNWWNWTLQKNIWIKKGRERQWIIRAYNWRTVVSNKPEPLTAAKTSWRIWLFTGSRRKFQ